jgi:CubicO group peptidase (beta-lactamase class C family)
MALRTIGAADFDAAGLSKIEARMRQFVEAQEISGAVTVVGSSRGVAHIAAIGSRNLERDEAMTADTLFRIASMTKPVVAMGIMKLVESGAMSVDDPVEKHVPEFRGQMLVADRKDGTVTLVRSPRPITLRDLLTHTSGLPGGYPEGFGDVYGQREHDLHESALVQSQRPLEFPPGSRWAYCNSGIDLLGRIIEIRSGMRFEEFLHKKFFEPLGMNDTAVFPSADRLARSAVVYEKKDGKLNPVSRPLIGNPVHARHSIPAGGLFSTGPDLAKMYQMLLCGGEGNGTRVLTTESLKTMTQLQTGDLPCGFVEGMGFGFGFAHVRQPQGVTRMLSAGTFGHGGAFGTQGWIDPHQDLFVILLIQRSGLPNGDASPIRDALQQLAVDALRPAR